MDWIAQYNDGTEIRSADGAKYKDICRFKLEKFVLLHENKPLVVLNLDGNKRLIMRKRTAISMNSESMSVWIVGWQEKVAGVNRQMVCFVFPDGTVEITDGFREGHRWFYPVVFRPEEL